MPVWSHRAFSQFGGPYLRTVFVILSALTLVVRRRIRSATVLVVAVGGAGALNTMLKLVVRRGRPERLPGASQAGGYSFPSGHTTGTFVFFGTIPYLLWSGARPRAATIAALGSVVVTAFVGRSRVALREHHEGDVLGSYAVGALWLGLVLKASARPLRHERAQRAARHR